MLAGRSFMRFEAREAHDRNNFSPNLSKPNLWILKKKYANDGHTASDTDLALMESASRQSRAWVERCREVPRGAAQ
eukprot:s1156_g29.t1